MKRHPAGYIFLGGLLFAAGVLIVELVAWLIEVLL